MPPPPRRRGPSAARIDPWFPSLAAPAGLRLFCLPHAGAGVSAFRAWPDRLPGAVEVCPVELPGRESRSREPPLREMSGLVEALGQAMSPHTERPFALFGHSMGAAVAFELARWLRRHRLPPPQLLAVSAARAPQTRQGQPPRPAPSREELVNELRRRGGLPPQAFENQALLRVVLPPLEADAHLYRGHVYEEDEPFDLPIRAYGGASDPDVPREQLEAWRAQTRASFELRLFPGGHFYLRDHLAALLEALASHLAPVAG